MKHFTILLILTVLISGCAKQSPTENLVDVANQTIDTMYNTVPVECRTDTLTNLRDTSKKQVRAIDDACTLQKNELRAKIRERNWVIASLVLLILLSAGVNMFLRPRQ